MPYITYSVSNDTVYEYHDGIKHSTRKASALEALQARQIAVLDAALEESISTRKASPLESLQTRRIAALEDALEEAISIIEDAAEPSYSSSYSPADMLEAVGRFQRLVDGHE